MKMRSVVSGLAAGAVMLVAGAALSGGVTASSAQLVNFDRNTSELLALPAGQPLTPFLNQQFTTYAPANLGTYVPPDPCLPPAAAWNFTVAYDQANNTKSTFVYELLLGAMSNLACGATLTSLASGSPQPLVTITPGN